MRASFNRKAHEHRSQTSPQMNDCEVEPGPSGHGAHIHIYASAKCQPHLYASAPQLRLYLQTTSSPEGREAMTKDLLIGFILGLLLGLSIRRR